MSSLAAAKSMDPWSGVPEGGRAAGAGDCPLPVFVSIVACLALYGCTQMATGGPLAPAPPKDENHSSTLVSESDGRRTAVAVPLGPEAARRTYSIDTSLLVDEDVTVMARMGGIVETLHADRGSKVTKGQPLLTLMNRDLQLIVKHAEITLEQKTADFERVRRLHEERLVPVSEFDDSRLARERARVEVEIARENLEKSIVRAPFDGVIIDRFARIGQKITEDESIPLFRITTLSPLLARLYLPEEVARSLKQGGRVEVQPRYLPSVSVTGTLRWLSRVIDASSGTCQAIVTVPGGGARGPLSPGTAVTVILNLAVGAEAVLIPRAAIDGEIDGPSDRGVRVEVLDNGKPIWRRVLLGGSRGDSVEILAGLRAGERVILRPDPAHLPASEPEADR